MDPIPRSFPAVRFLALVAVWGVSITASSALVGQDRVGVSSGLIPSSTLTATSRWVFRAKESVTISSPIVRLGDIVHPVDPNLAAWRRLARSPVGLVPASGQIMTIDRQRLTRLILSVEATPRVIDWLGPEKIQVKYRKQTASHESVAVSSHAQQASSSQQETSGIQQVLSVQPGDEPLSHGEPLTKIESDRVVHWIELAMKRFQPDVAKRYAVTVNPKQPGLSRLRHIAGVTGLDAVDQIAQGQCPFAVTARTPTGPVNCQVAVTLVALPQVIVARRSLGRGQRVQASDLEQRPFRSDRIGSDVVRDLESIVGMEVRTSLRVGVPISHSDVGSPLLVHRGDLIEVRVMGGGINVSTNAKSLKSGARGELIEIETISPRKRLVARVAEVGIVEILTRPPVVR